ncbi:MAG: nucleotidyltransferase domain-containing protein [Anaerolineae bacterium]
MVEAKSGTLSSRVADQDLIHELTALLEEYPTVQAAYLFGSRARGTHVAVSDVDVGVIFERDASAWDEIELQEKLVSRLGIPAQVVNLAHASPDIIEAVHRDGIPLVGDTQLVEGHRTMENQEDSKADEAIWLLESAADKIERIDSALPLLADVELQAVLAEEMTAVRDFLGVYVLLVEPLETLVRRISRYAHLVLGHEEPDASLRAQTELTAEILGVSDEVLEAIAEMARLRGRLAHAYWDLDAEEIERLAPEQLRPALEHLVERASRFVVVEQARWQRPGSRLPNESDDH